MKIRLFFKISSILIITTALSNGQLNLIATMSGDSTGDLFSVVSYIGDVNADGYDDVIVGAPGGNYAKLFFGGSVFDTIPDMVFLCEQPASRFGYAIAGGMDVNGDGYPDFVIGAPYYWYGGKPLGICESGKVYVYFGGPDVDTTADAEMFVDGWYYFFGNSIALGDLNNDGFADIIVGAPMDDYDAPGRVFIYYGGHELDNNYDYLFEGESMNTFGESVAYAGDVNKDGYGDLLIGAPQGLLRPYTGKAYLVYGGDSISLSNSTVFFGDSTAHGQFGRVVAGLGNVNGDGFDDFGIMGFDKTQILFGSTDLDTTLKLLIYSLKDFGFIGTLGDLNKDNYDDFVIVSDSVEIHFGAVLLDTNSTFKWHWATPVCRIENINSDERIEFACAVSGGWDSRGKVYIYSYDSPNYVKEDENSGISKHFELCQNYPNPFNNETMINYEISKTGYVSLEVYNLLGQRVRTLINNIKNKGKYSMQVNASDLPSGVYFYRLKTDHGSISKTMLLIK